MLGSMIRTYAHIDLQIFMRNSLLYSKLHLFDGQIPYSSLHIMFMNIHSTWIGCQAENDVWGEDTLISIWSKLGSNSVAPIKHAIKFLYNQFASCIVYNAIIRAPHSLLVMI